MFRRSLTHFKVPFPVLRNAGAFPRFDLCVIGGGPGGIAAAMRAVDYGKSVCIVESDHLGGADLWGGTVPSKMLWQIADFTSTLTDSAFAKDLLNQNDARRIISDVPSERITALMQRTCAEKEAELRHLLKAAGVQVMAGKASFSSPHEVDVHTKGTGEYRSLQADNFIIATGSRPRSHSLAVCDHKHIVNSRDIFHLSVPKSMVVIGAGAMGCEVASMYAKLGRTKIYLIDKSAHVLPKEDEDVAMYVQKHLIRRGVIIHHDCHLFDLESVDGECQYSVRNICTGDIETYHVERAMLAVGRVPNLETLGLENTKMRVENAVLDQDEYGRCKPYKHIFCIGDATGTQKTVNLARTAGLAAIDTMFGCSPRRAVNTSMLSNVATDMFVEDEVAGIGMNEQQCRAKEISYCVAKLELRHLTRFVMMGRSEGFVKLIVTNDGEKRVLGVRAVGPHAGSVVEVASLPIRNNGSVYTMLKDNPAYPSLAEGVTECAAMLVSRNPHRSDVADRISIKTWTPDNRVPSA
ncbi:2-oxoglutarate dehydrogenase e3 component lipoamidedehydrogenase-like protein [Leptomonas seymouri]|uniref:2-oxoglutarate dehydrogenase e3 component lipoamidedehydrogenase-like protein n=1 Tax=Leptomonas seymouri TaxID=5684 RepID=A0A0N1IIN8_LEPSE|nr:2-oxoglutarate dehydrogenase e3 component lipoamidedehydrogenase-like protein [Leptomonas seymouri]|eukprot:KPI84924.1 2-oxoglutarate dehydrogenase e3 component lipoamidedehydrogenase-like protein [Leptomonas seymouri]